MELNQMQITPAPVQRKLWPDYASTQVICFSSWKNGIARGELYSFYFEEAFPFVGLDGLLLAMEAVMDKAEHPAAWEKMRKLIPQKQSRRPPQGERVYTRASVPGQPFYLPDGLLDKHGQICTVAVRVHCRQHASMQGELRACGKPVCFRSALELLHLLRETLDLTVCKEGGNRNK